MVQATSNPLQMLEMALVTIVENNTKAAPQEILMATQTIDELLLDHSGKLEPQLVHYLKRRSYSKALAHLRQAETA